MTAMNSCQTVVLKRWARLCDEATLILTQTRQQEGSLIKERDERVAVGHHVLIEVGDHAAEEF